MRFISNTQIYNSITQKFSIDTTRQEKHHDTHGREGGGLRGLMFKRCWSQGDRCDGGGCCPGLRCKSGFCSVEYVNSSATKKPLSQVAAGFPLGKCAAENDYCGNIPCCEPHNLECRDRRCTRRRRNLENYVTYPPVCAAEHQLCGGNVNCCEQPQQAPTAPYKLECRDGICRRQEQCGLEYDYCDPRCPGNRHLEGVPPGGGNPSGGSSFGGQCRRCCSGYYCSYYYGYCKRY